MAVGKCSRLSQSQHLQVHSSRLLARPYLLYSLFSLLLISIVCLSNADIIETTTPATLNTLSTAASPTSPSLADSDTANDRYRIAFYSTKPSQRAIEESNSPMMYMLSKDGSKHVCLLPPVVTPDAKQDDKPQQTIPDLRRSLHAIVAENFEKKCIYHLEGWWAYEYCFGKQVRQFHQDGDVIQAEYFLGVSNLAEIMAGNANYVEEFDQTQKVINTFNSPEHPNAIPYYSIVYKNGTPCELNATPREVEVRHFCLQSGKTFFAGVKEPRSCHYVINVNVGGLCNHPSFAVAPETSEIKLVRCYPEN